VESEVSFDKGLAKASVLSADEDEFLLPSDLFALKATYLYADDVQLASARLYYTLLAMRGPHNKHLRERFSDLEERIGLTDVVDLEQIGLTMINDYPISENAVRAVEELAEGFRAGAFTVLPYEGMVEATSNLMLGGWDWLGIPVLDQPTFEVLDGIYKISLQTMKPEAQGLVGPAGSRKVPSPAWVTNEFLANMPVFPKANWVDLLEMREYLRPGRPRFLEAIQTLARSLEDDTPAGIAVAAKMWNKDVRERLEEIDDLLNEVKSLPSWRKFIGDGRALAMLGVGLAATDVAPDPHRLAAEGLGLAVAGLGQLLMKQANERRVNEHKARRKPYWFLYKVKEWQV